MFIHWEPLAFAIFIYLKNPRLLIAMEFEPRARGVNVHGTYLGEGDLEEEGQNDDYYQRVLEMLLLLELLWTQNGAHNYS